MLVLQFFKKQHLHLQLFIKILLFQKKFRSMATLIQISDRPFSLCIKWLNLIPMEHISPAIQTLYIWFQFFFSFPKANVYPAYIKRKRLLKHTNETGSHLCLCSLSYQQRTTACQANKSSVIFKQHQCPL